MRTEEYRRGYDDCRETLRDYMKDNPSLNGFPGLLDLVMKDCDGDTDWYPQCESCIYYQLDEMENSYYCKLPENQRKTDGLVCFGKKEDEVIIGKKPRIKKK